MTSSSPVLLFKNGVLIEPISTHKELLLQNPAGAYTVARTLENGHNVFEHSFHLQRLTDSFCSLSKSDTITEETKERLKVACLESLKTGFKRFHELMGEQKFEIRLCFLVLFVESKSVQPFELFLHLSILPPPPEPPIIVELKGKPRHQAKTKDSEWVKECQAAVGPGINECLLVDDGGGIPEGMSSNFFVVMDGKVQTTDEGILLGSVRNLVLRVCAILDIPVVFERPNTNDMNKWESAFITSTSRFALPIDRIKLAENNFYNMPARPSSSDILTQIIIEANKIRVEDSEFII